MVYRTPLQEEEDYPQYQPLRRRRSLVEPYHNLADPYHNARGGYRAEDLPGEPKVRRASLYTDREHIPVKDRPQQPERQEQHASQRKRPQQIFPLDRSVISQAIARKQRAPASRPLPPAQHSRHISQKRSLPEQLLDLRHNPAAIVVLSICLLVFVASSVIYGFSHINTSATTTTYTDLPASSASNTNNTGVVTISHAGDPHEIVITPEDTNHPAPPVYAQSAYLLDADTGATLYAYNPFMHLPGMSTTKLMTAILAVEHGNLDQQVTINSSIEHDISQLSADSSLFGMKQGQTYTLRQLLYGLLLVSGNDAAVAIADTVSGNQANFVAMMNVKAQQLGLLDTHYMNPHGLLDPNQYTCAHDLAILGKYALSNPIIHQISGTETYTIPQGNNHPQRILDNDNQFLWWYPGVDGGKPGYDGASDFVQVISATRNNHHLISVVMHTNDWWTDERDLLNWGFDNFTWVSPYNVDLQHPIPYDNLWNFFSGDKKENTIPTANNGRYYIYTGYSIAGLIMAYFDAHGGLNQFGYPESMVTVTSNTTILQHFQQGSIQCSITSNACIRL
jgi:D-alanyl-D-alanine carboxypeptidase